MATIPRWWRSRHDRLSPIAVMLAVVAFALLALNEPTVWVGDNRFEMFQNPGRRLERMLSIWDVDRGFGTLQAEVWVGNTVPLWVMHKLGMSIATMQYVWHGFLLTTAGTGAAAFMRCFRPRIDVSHVVAALLYMLGPFAVGFLLPSNLFQNYAIAPILFTLCYRGLHSRRPLREAAAFALVILFTGLVDTPGLLYAGLFMVPVVLYAVMVDQTTTWRRVWSWTFSAGVLTVLVMAGPLFAAGLGQELFEQNVRETESPGALGGNSSWSESWRGLGGWLLYFEDQSGTTKPQVQLYLTNMSAMAATFVAPIVAVATLAFSDRRERVLFGSLMVMGLIFMVGQYPLDDPSPFGDALRWLFDAAPQSRVLRSTYKAGAGAMLGIACLAGLGVAHATTAMPTLLAWIERHAGPLTLPSLHVPFAAFLIVLTIVAQPFWRTGLYDSAELEDIPAYVPEAFAWLDEQPGEGRALVLPAVNRAEFRWGSANDDVVDAFLGRPHIAEVPIHVSRPIPATVLTALDASLHDDRYETGSIGGYGERFGLDYVMIRNDLEWESWDIQRPVTLSSLRADSALELVATFGEPGQFTTSILDTSAEASNEALLHPIEIYRLIDPGDIVHVEAVAPQLIIAGDGESWPRLMSTGVLADPARTVVFSGELSAGQLAAALDGGAEIVITDSNRRRADIITLSSRETYTLAANAKLDREPNDLFNVPGSQTVASYGDAVNVTNLGIADPLGILQPWFRPAAAIDGHLETAWLVGQPITRGEGVRIELREPTPIGEVTIILADHPDSEREITAVEVRLSDGSSMATEPIDGIVRVNLGDAEASWIDVSISDASHVGGGYIGFSEITVEGVLLEERLVAPTDLFDRADHDAALAKSLGAAPISYLFERAIGVGAEPEEQTFHREFRGRGGDAVVLSGEVSLDMAIAPGLLASLLGDPIVAATNEVLFGQLRFSGQSAVDSDPTTAWAFAADTAGTVELVFEPTVVDTIEIDLRVGVGLGDVDQIVVDAGDEIVTVDVVARDCEGQCTQTVVAELDGSSIAGAKLRLTATLDSGIRTIRVDEIRINGSANDAGRPGACADGAISLNGSSAPVALAGTRSNALLGRSVPFATCSSALIADGSNNLDAAPGFAPLYASLAREPTAASLAVSPALTITSHDGTNYALSIDAPDGARLVLGQSWHPAWRASVDGVDLGAAEPADTMASWVLPRGEGLTVKVWFAYQSWFTWALRLSAASTVACFAIIAFGKPRKATS